MSAPECHCVTCSRGRRPRAHVSDDRVGDAALGGVTLFGARGQRRQQRARAPDQLAGSASCGGSVQDDLLPRRDRLLHDACPQLRLAHRFSGAHTGSGQRLSNVVVGVIEDGAVGPRQTTVGDHTSLDPIVNLLVGDRAAGAQGCSLRLTGSVEDKKVRFASFHGRPFGMHVRADERIVRPPRGRFRSPARSPRTEP